MAPRIMLHIPRVMNNVTGVQVTLRGFPRNLKDCNVGVIGGGDL
jgi:hypothetical protein